MGIMGKQGRLSGGASEGNDIKEDREEMEGAPGEDEKMPDGVVVWEPLPSIESDPARISQTAEEEQ